MADTFRKKEVSGEYRRVLPPNFFPAACFAFIAGCVTACGGIAAVAALFVAGGALWWYRRRHESFWVWSSVLVAVFASGILRFHAGTLTIPLPSSVRVSLASIHESIAAPFQQLFPSDEASLATGLVIGVDTQFSTKLRAAMRGSGTTHLVALSGYNVSIIIASLLALLTRFMGRRQAVWTASCGIVFFTLVAGTQPSLVRAAIMGILALLAYESGRVYRIHHAVLYAGTAMLVFGPSVLTNLGAQLSFLSLLGLVYIEPLLPFRAAVARRGLDVIREQVRTTTAAQLGVLPLVLLTFGRTNLLSVVANTLILPFVPLAMLLAVITSFTALFLPAIVFLPALPLQLFLTYMVQVVYLFSHIMIPLQWQMTPLEAVLTTGAAAAAIGYAHHASRQIPRR